MYLYSSKEVLLHLTSTYTFPLEPGRAVQLVVCLTEESEVLCSIPGLAHNFLEIDHDSSNERSQHKFYWRNTLKCLSIGTPKTFNFPFVSNGKLKSVGDPNT